MPTEPEPRTLELRDYLRVMWRRKWTIAVTVVLVVAGALTMAFLEEPTYRAEAKLELAPDLSETIFTGGGVGPAVAERGIATELQLMGSPTVVEAVAEELGRPVGAVSFQSIPDTNVVAVLVKSRNAEDAAETANVYARTYIEVRREQQVEELLEAGSQIQAEIDELNLRIAELDGQLLGVPSPAPAEGERSAPTDPRVIERARLDSQRGSFLQQLEKLQVGVEVTQQGGAHIFAEAGVPTTPVNKTPVRNGVAGLGLGLMLGAALAFLREYLDDTVKSKDDLERASGATVIGLIPSVPEWKDRKSTPLVSMVKPRSRAAEAYRTVRTSVEFLGLDHPIHRLQVTSATAAEGKTTTLANLATTFARAGQRVIVLCCDLRRPRVHEFFGLTNTVGFTSVLLGDTPLTDAIQRVPGGLPIGLIASGPLPPNPAELLSSKRAADTLDAVDQQCDLLLIDSPPVVPVTDALVIAGLVDGLLLVADARSTTKRGLTRATELLRQVDAPVIGAVLNSVRSDSEYGYVYGDEYLSARSDQAGTEINGSRRRSSRQPARASR